MNEPLRQIVEEILPQVEKPSRYLGSERNAVCKAHSEVQLRIALAFPDLYDLGLSNLGLLILYHILNSQPGIAAERVYAPGPDLEAILSARRLPLFSWESRTPLSQFDAIGFTLQYELTYTNLLNMLHLSGIPLLATERTDQHPILLAGGPGAFNPEPLAEVIDAFAVGDGEELVLEIATALQQTKGLPRRHRLERLASLEGVYVPTLYTLQETEDGVLVPVGPKVRRRVVAHLDEAPFPTRYLVPFTQQVHDRVSLEVLRGCTQGCRFCQAGMVTRPVRERSVEQVAALIKEVLRHTGYDEVALASLNTCDHSRIRSLVQRAVEVAAPWGSGISLPSLRLDSFSVELAEMVQGLRKTGITFAPEAATSRLRRVINKEIADEDLLEMTEEVFRRGWETIKLYFMIGLPTETDDDVIAIAHLARQVAERGRRLRRTAQVHLSVATFVPKPHTPFQWESQLSLEETHRRQRLLQQHLRGVPGVQFGRHNAFASYLEGLLCRGDRRVGRALQEAWRRGCKMDAWSERLQFDKWQEAFAAVGLDPDRLLEARHPDALLPWDPIDALVSKEALWREREYAYQGRTTPDCRRGHCHQCGVHTQVPDLCAAMLRRTHGGAQQEAEWRQSAAPLRPALNPIQRIRFRFAKRGPARLLSHLETVNVWTRALRRAQIPLAYSQGFHPQPKIAFGTALALGIESEAEYADVLLNERRDVAAFQRDLNATLPEGFQVLAAAEIPLKAPSLTATIQAARYEVWCAPQDVAAFLGDAHARVSAFLQKETCVVMRPTKQGVRPVNLRPLVRDLWARRNTDGGLVLEMVLWEREGARCRPQEVASALFEETPENIPWRVRKRETYRCENGQLRPMLEEDPS